MTLFDGLRLSAHHRCCSLLLSLHPLLPPLQKQTKHEARINGGRGETMHRTPLRLRHLVPHGGNITGVYVTERLDKRAYQAFYPGGDRAPPPSSFTATWDALRGEFIPQWEALQRVINWMRKRHHLMTAEIIPYLTEDEACPP